MISVGSFEDEMASLKNNYKHGSYEYTDPLESFRTCTISHFRSVEKQKKYGVYVVRQRDTEEVLYVGKGGTINSEGRFKGQDMPGRLRNVKNGSISADIWFKDLLQNKGPLLIEYIFLSTSRCPAFVETTLLQAFLNEYGRLPYKNKSL